MKQQINNVRFPVREPAPTYGLWFIALLLVLVIAGGAIGFALAIWS